MDPSPFVDEMKAIPIPIPLSAEYDRRSKEEPIAHHVSKLNQEVVGSKCIDQLNLGNPGISG